MGPIKVVDIELSRPLEDIENLNGYVALKGLVRLYGTPLGYIQAPITNKKCTANAVGQAILDSYGFPIVKQLLTNRLLTSPLAEKLEVEQLFNAPVSRLHSSYRLVTVVVCTRDRTNDLAMCLEALLQLDYPYLDFLVVDNAPTTNATQQLVAEKFPQVRYVCEPRPGLDWARNRAIVEAKGEIIAYTDDDVIVDAGWVKALVQPFLEDASVMAVTGLVAPYELETSAQIMFEMYGGFGRGFKRRWCRVDEAGNQWEYRGTGQFGTGANMAYRRRAFDLIGPFDPALDVGTITNGGGDLEMFFRVLKEGYTLVYEPGAIVKHRHRRTYQELRRQISYNGVALYAFFVRSVQAYPEERWPFIRLGIWWFWWWFVRRLILSFLRPDLLPRDLIWAEMGSVATGLRCYKKSRQHAMQISETFSDQPTLLPAEKPPVSSKDKRKYKTAIRTVDISKPLLAITDVSEYAAARVFVTRNEQLLGHIDIPNNFKSIPTLHLIETIVDGMTWKLLGSEGQQNADRIWNDINNSLNRWLLTEDLPRDQIIKQPLAADISVSVIVGTYDRPDDLYKCLESIHRQQTDRPVEVVVVDNNPGSGKTAPVVAQFPDVTLVNEPRKGVSYARNAAINASHGDIIVTTDDDVTMPVDWLEKLLAPLACQHVMAVTGNILPVELETDAQHLFESYGGLGRGYEPKEANFEWFEKFRIHAVPTWEYGGTANAAFRSFLFKQSEIGLMEESLGPGMPSGVGEDTYLFYKILKAGYTIRYEPTAYVWHNHRRTWAALRRQIYNYSKGHVAYHLTTLFRDADLRALLQLVLWLPLGHMWRIASRITGKSDYTLLLLFNEIMGNCVGSFVLLISLWRVRSQGRSSHYVPVPERNMLHLPSPLRKTQQIQLPSTLTTPDHVKR